MSFFDMFGPMFDPESGPNRSQGQRANKSGNDDPIILNVETDGDNTARSSANMPPRGPSGPRITRQPNRPRKSSNGNKILIGVVLRLPSSSACSLAWRSSSPTSCGMRSLASKA